MANIENIKLNNTTYPLRDKTTYQSLTSAQATDLLNNGTYNGSDVDNDTIFTMEDGTFQKFEKELVPEQPTFTVVGSPTITDRVISGFSQSDYIKIDETFPNSVSSVDIVFAGTVVFNYIFESPLLSNTGETALLFSIGSQGNRTFSIYNNGWVNGTNTLNYGAKYWFRVIYDGSTWTGYTIEDDNYTIDTLPAISSWRQEWQSNDASWILGKKLDIGVNHYGSGFWEGSIDLNNSYIKVDGEYWWTPYATRYVCSLKPLSYNKSSVDTALSGKQNTLTAGTGIKIEQEKDANFTIVGSLTITDGIVSGFGDSDYLYINKTIPSSYSSFDFITKGKLNSNNHDCIIFAPRNANIGSVFISAPSNGRKFSYWDGSANYGTTTISDGTDVWYRIKSTDGTNFKGYTLVDNNYTLDTLPDISNWTEEWSGTGISTLLNGYVLNFGLETEGSGYNNFWEGSLDFNNTAIYLNGDLWWEPYTINPNTKPAITVDIGSGASAPTSSTAGYIGKLFVTTGGAVYICTGVSGSTYTWAQITVS